MRAIVFALCREDEIMKPHWEAPIEVVGGRYWGIVGHLYIEPD